MVTWEKKTNTMWNNGVFFFCFPAKFIHKEEHSLWHSFSSLCISSLIFVFTLITSFRLSTYHNLLLLIFLLLFIFFPHIISHSASYPTNQNLMRVKKGCFIYRIIRLHKLKKIKKGSFSQPASYQHRQVEEEKKGRQ